MDGCLLVFFSLSDLSLVESQFFTFQDVAVAATALARSRADHGVQTTGLELFLQRGLDLALLLQSFLMFLLDAARHLFVLGSLLLLSSSTQGRAVVGLVPGSEGRCVDLHNGRLGQRVGAHKLVVGRVEGDDDDTCLAGDALATPAEVACVESETSEFSVAAAGSHEMDSLRANTRVGWLTTFFKGSARSFFMLENAFVAGLRSGM